MDRGAWWAIVHGVTKSWTRLSDSPHTHTHTHSHTRTLKPREDKVCWIKMRFNFRITF